MWFCKALGPWINPAIFFTATTATGTRSLDAAPVSRGSRTGRSRRIAARNGSRNESGGNGSSGGCRRSGRNSRRSSAEFAGRNPAGQHCRSYGSRRRNPPPDSGSATASPSANNCRRPCSANSAGERAFAWVNR